MTAKEYLQQARSLDMLINAKQDELYALRLTATSVSSPMLGDKVKSGSNNNAMQIVDKIIALQELINSEVDRLVDLKTEIHSRIEKLSDPYERLILTERYLNNKGWEEISRLLHYEERNTLYLHGKALQHFAPFCSSLH